MLSGSVRAEPAHQGGLGPSSVTPRRILGGQRLASASAPAGALPVDRDAFLRYREQLDRQLETDEAAAARGAPLETSAARVSPAARGSSDAAPSAAQGGCLLYTAQAATAPSQDCLACHGGHGAGAHLNRTHPVDVDFAASQAKPGSSLRPEAEVVKRGVFLPDGKVRCATCHDARSDWMYKLALPPGAPAKPPVSLADHASFEGASLPARLLRPATQPMPRGAAVSPTPLCLACHAMD